MRGLGILVAILMALATTTIMASAIPMPVALATPAPAALAARTLTTFASPGLAAEASAQSSAGKAGAAKPGTAIIGELHFSGSVHYSEEQLLAASGLKTGDTVTADQLQAVADAFSRLGLFTSATFHYASHGNKVSVQFDFADAPAYPVSFDNFPWFTDGEINTAIRSAVPLFDGKAPADGVMLDLISGAIAKLLPSRGIDGTVEHMLIRQSEGTDADFGADQTQAQVQTGDESPTVQFSVSGPQLTIGSLEYGDGLAQNSEALKDRTGDLLGKPFSRLAIAIFENEQIRPLYSEAGHLRVKFGEPVTRLTGDPNQALPAQLPLLLPIVPGPIFTLSNVAASGNAALNAKAISAALDLVSGQPADGMKLTEAWQNLEREYRRNGYLDVKIEPQPEFDEAASTVSYVLAIQEGPQYHMHDLILTGLTQEASDAVELRWELKRGAVANGAYMDDMLEKLAKPSEQIFGSLPVHYSKVGHWVRPDPATKTVDVLIDFQ